MELHALASKILEGDRRAVARLMSWCEDSHPDARQVLAELHPHTGKAHIIGVTGPPGSGKSTVVDKLTLEYRKAEQTVGIIAVDPTSPFTGGALLGDRIRMNEVAMDKGVFLRSMGTRGQLGGLAQATNDLIKILDAFGKDIILVETVGAGQSEVDIVKTAHTTIIVEVPGLGDDIQAIKAGILEIGDVLVVNKTDLEGADRTVLELQAMLDLNPDQEGWKPPILKTRAKDGEGIIELKQAIEEHARHLKSTGQMETRLESNTRMEFLEILKNVLMQHTLSEILTKDELDRIIDDIIEKKIDPYTATDNILKKYQA